jgi:methylated-DNA-[protein]-cysteine S-methyltransferase
VTDTVPMRETVTLALETPIGTIGIVASAEGLRRVQLPGGGALRPAGEGTSGEAAERARAAAAQLEEYLAGERHAFDVELDWNGVDERHRNVLETLVAAAPFGRTVTYGELGRRAGEDDPREIGRMMATNPLPLVVPCHRVVAADGLGGYGGGLELKRRLLELEHVLPARLLGL